MGLSHGNLNGDGGEEGSSLYQEEKNKTGIFVKGNKDRSFGRKGKD